MSTRTFYVVTYRTHRYPEVRRSHRAREDFRTLAEAREEADSLLRRNQYFVEVDGFKPYIYDVEVWKVTREETWTRVDE